MNSTTKRSALLLCTLIVTALLTACGGLSNADALFLLSLPTADEVRLDVGTAAEVNAGPASIAQALSDKANTYTQLSQTAAGLNRSVEETLNFVHELGRSGPPTSRSGEQRVWGPVRDLNGSGITLRLEISRLPEKEDQGLNSRRPRFFICLQAARDKDYTGGPGSCQGEGDAGLRPILWGEYSPGRNTVETNNLTTDTKADALRAGNGEIFINLGVFRILEPSSTAQGVYHLTYAFSEGGAQKSIAIEISNIKDFGAVRSLSYLYGLKGGCVDFYVRFMSNLEDTGPLLEQHVLEAQWTLNGTGRSDLRISGGDFPLAFSASVTECWDENQNSTYLNWLPEIAAEQRQEGDETNCPQACGF